MPNSRERPSILGFVAYANPWGRVPDHFSAGEPGFDASTRQYTAVGYQFEHRVNARRTVRQKLRYVDASFDWREVAFQALRADYRTADRYASRLVRSGHGLALDNQAQAELQIGQVSHTLLVGLDYQRETADSLNEMGRAAPLDIYRPVYGGAISLMPRPRGNANQIIEQTGGYAQDQIKLGRFSLWLGGRYDHARSSATDKLNASTTRQTDKVWSKRAGLVYELADGIAPYLSYAESFQPVGGVDANGDAFQPARGKQVEFGVKAQPQRGAMLSLAAFDLKEDNLTAPDESHIGVNAQFGQVRTRGVEFEARMALTRALNLAAAYTYLDSNITRGAPAQIGKSRPNVPRHTASAWVEAAFGDGVLRGLAAGAGVRYVGASPANMADALNDFKAPAYTVADFALRYDLAAASEALRGTQLELNIQNLFDKDYVGSCGGASIAAGYCWAGYGRTALASLRYRW